MTPICPVEFWILPWVHALFKTLDPPLWPVRSDCSSQLSRPSSLRYHSDAPRILHLHTPCPGTTSLCFGFWELRTKRKTTVESVTTEFMTGSAGPLSLRAQLIIIRSTLCDNKSRPATAGHKVERSTFQQQCTKGLETFAETDILCFALTRTQ